jgi:hypothetical protein
MVPLDGAMSTDEFLRQRAVNLVVGGRYSLANWFDPKGNRREFACRTSRISPFRMMVSVPVVGKVGERVVAYFHDFGELDGQISDVSADSFLIDLEVDKARREKIADKLKWLEKKQQDAGVQDVRANKRIIPRNPHSTVIFADGTQRACFVIDVSTSGVAVSTDVCPDIGTPLAVGVAVGRVVRHLREGFAVKFAAELDSANLERLVIRSTAESRSDKSTNGVDKSHEAGPVQAGNGSSYAA